MVVLDSAAAIGRALAQVGQADGAGACLANVYKWFGSVPSIGAHAGQYPDAISAWNYGEYHFENDMNPPAGVPVYFGTHTSRTDKNASKGDVVLSIGGGRVVCTDSPNGNTGIMTIAARGRQIDRNYLGWDADFLGHQVSGALSYIAERQGQKAQEVAVPPIAVVRKSNERLPVFSVVPLASANGRVVVKSLLTGKQATIGDPNHISLLLRLKANDSTDQMFQSELDTCAGYLAAIA